MRLIIIDIKSGDTDEIFGKDLAETNAPDDVLADATEFVANKENGSCAEDDFISYVLEQGYTINMINTLDEIPMFVASNENY